MLKKNIGIAALIILITSFILHPGKDLKSVFRKINENVLHQGKAYESLRDITEKIGHRLTGSENGHRAEDYAFNLFKKYGYKNVTFQEFKVEAWSRISVALKISLQNGDKSMDYPVVSLAHSPVSSHLSGEIIDLGDGLKSDFEKAGDAVRDKIVLANINVRMPENKGKSNLHRSEKTALAIQYGAKGIILSNGAKGGVLLTGTASVTGKLISIPAVCISLESGEAIRKRLSEEGKLTARIDMENSSKPITARNVIATLEGSSPQLKGESIILGGHLDSWDLATGAIDNGVGAFSVLDIARVFKELKLKTDRTIHFVLFMGEEQGLLGSKYMVSQLERLNEIKKAKLMINLDMANNTKGFNAGGDEDLLKLMQQIGTVIKQVDTSYANENKSSLGLHSDHQPFMLAGVQVASAVGSLPPGAWGCYHADCDHFNLVIKEQLDNNVRYVAMMLYALANETNLPTRFLNSLETRDLMIKHNLKDELILGNEWGWDK